MKIHTGFVSNSSSSSFVPIKTNLNTIEEFTKQRDLEMSIRDNVLIIKRDGKDFGEITIEDVAFFVNFIRNTPYD